MRISRYDCGAHRAMELKSFSTVKDGIIFPVSVWSQSERSPRCAKIPRFFLQIKH